MLGCKPSLVRSFFVGFCFLPIIVILSAIIGLAEEFVLGIGKILGVGLGCYLVLLFFVVPLSCFFVQLKIVEHSNHSEVCLDICRRLVWRRELQVTDLDLIKREWRSDESGKTSVNELYGTDHDGSRVLIIGWFVCYIFKITAFPLWGRSPHCNISI